MFVYVCFKTGLEGCSTPLAVFATDDEALNFCLEHEKKMGRLNEGEGCVYMPYEIGVISD